MNYVAIAVVPFAANVPVIVIVVVAAAVVTVVVAAAAYVVVGAVTGVAFAVATVSVIRTIEEKEKNCLLGKAQPKQLLWKQDEGIFDHIINVEVHVFLQSLSCIRSHILLGRDWSAVVRTPDIQSGGHWFKSCWVLGFFFYFPFNFPSLQC